MRLRIHHPLFAGFLGIVGLLVVLIVFLVGSGLRRELKDTFRGELERQLALAAWLASEAEDIHPDSLARAMTRRLGYRVSVIGTDGTVLGDSYVERERISLVENHADRPEVRGALEGRGDRVSFSERTSATVGVSLLYAARRATRGGQEVVLRIAAPLDEIEATVDRVQGTVAVTGMVAMLLALIVAYGLSVVLARPLVLLSDRARRLAEGDFTLKAPRGSRVAELDDLSLAFNRLTDELQNRLGELRRERDEMQALIDCMAEGVVALTDDARVLRVNRAARALLALPEVPDYSPVGAVVRHPDLRELLEESVAEPKQTREITLGDRHLFTASRMLDLGGAVTTFLDVTELRRLEQVRRDFVANASHELKTPLTSIRGFAETLLEGDPPPKLKHEFLSSIRNNTLRLQRLVDDLLDLSRLESGGWTPRPEPLSVASVAREVWGQFRDRAKEKAVEVAVEGDVKALADPQGLEQIFRNLFENAVRHADEGGRVRVDVSGGSGEEVTVEVSDDGEGIPSRILPRVFERFYRADTSRARDFGGTGLGLAIVRHLVTAMGGDVEAESELGRGATIRFTLPAA